MKTCMTDFLVVNKITNYFGHTVSQLGPKTTKLKRQMHWQTSIKTANHQITRYFHNLANSIWSQSEVTHWSDKTKCFCCWWLASVSALCIGQSVSYGLVKFWKFTQFWTCLSFFCRRQNVRKQQLLTSLLFLVSTMSMAAFFQHSSKRLVLC